MGENQDPTDRGVVSRIPCATLPRPPDGDRAVVTALGALRLHYPGQPMTEAQERVFWAAYLTDLAGWNPRMVAEACSRWRRSPERFFPNPGQLLDLCRKVAAERPRTQGARYREQLERDGWRPPTPEEKAKVAALMDQVRAKIKRT